jgi:hypothetical protein
MGIMDSKYTMLVDVYTSGAYVPDFEDVTPPTNPGWTQDPVSGEIIFDPTPDIPDNSDEGTIARDTSLVYKNLPPGTVWANVQGILSGGIRVAGTTQRFSEVYENIDWIQISTDAPLHKGHVISNIRYRKTGSTGWVEEEIKDYPPTSFVVMGMTPVTAPFAGVIEYKGLAQRRDPQGV